MAKAAPEAVLSVRKCFLAEVDSDSRARAASFAEGRVRRAGMVRVERVKETPYAWLIVSAWELSPSDLTMSSHTVVPALQRKARGAGVAELVDGRTVRRPRETVPTNLRTETPLVVMIAT